MTHGLPPRIGPYELVEELASGGMARVVLARSTGVEGAGARVALKLIRPELAKDAEYVTMFMDEARMSARVRHRNVVRVLDVGRDSQTQILYMALELVLGATLSEVARAATLSTPVVLEALAQAGEGLHAAHQATAADGTPLSLVHRDVSPQNLLAGLDGVVRISDFGIARAAHRATRTRTGQFKGKLAYCSPEQALGKSVSPRSDVFALGIVGWELLAGRRLFAGRTPFDTLEKLLYEPVTPTGELRSDLPERAARVLDASLAKEPQDRPASAREVAAELREALSASSWGAPERKLAEAVKGTASARVCALAGIDPPVRPGPMALAHLSAAPEEPQTRDLRAGSLRAESRPAVDAAGEAPTEISAALSAELTSADATAVEEAAAVEEDATAVDPPRE